MSEWGWRSVEMELSVGSRSVECVEWRLVGVEVSGGGCQWWWSSV